MISIPIKDRNIVKTEKNIHQLILTLTIFFTSIGISSTDPVVFSYIIITIGIVFILFSFKVKDFNIAILAMIILIIPTLSEFVIFGTGLISLDSNIENRLIQNSIIYGIHLFLNILFLAPITYRLELSKKLFPQLKIKYTFADAIFPWLQLISIFLTAAALIENYVRHTYSIDITFVFYSYSLIIFMIYSFSASTIGLLCYCTYKDSYLDKLPRLIQKRD